MALPETVTGQILAGELIATPRPATPHSFTASVVGSELLGPFQLGRSGPGGWWIVDEPELHLGDDILVPDLAGWRKETLPSIPSGPFISVAPDWVCEILSPGSLRYDRVTKPVIYAREKISWMWIIDPVARTLEVFWLKEGKWTLEECHADREAVRARPFEAVELDLATLWLEFTQS